MGGKTDPILEYERLRSGVDVNSLTRLLDGSDATSRRRRYLTSVLEKDPVFSNKDNPYMNRLERMESALKKAAKLHVLCQRGGILHGIGPKDMIHVSRAINEPHPLTLHYLMFIPCIEALFTSEQKHYWLPRCCNLEVIGCYAQTELGHGSNIRALETTATYLVDSDEFEITTPTLSSIKWWPGGLGLVANHAMVIAQLVVKKKKLGLQNFIVPIRDLVTHKILPGIEVGDIGPKMGFNSVDNGFLRLKRVRVPRLNMAMQLNQLDSCGMYFRSSKNVKLAYLTMTKVRVQLIRDSGYYLAKGITIAVRYSAVRTQGFKKSATGVKGGGENQLLDYTTQLRRLIPSIAKAYAFQFAAKSVDVQLGDLEKCVGSTVSEDVSSLKSKLDEFHAVTSGLKSICTTNTAADLEDARKACGGHGYLVSSGLPDMIQTYLQSCTVEGDNGLLLFETAKYLIKVSSTLIHGNRDLPMDCRYLQFDGSNGLKENMPTCTASCGQDLRSVETQCFALEHRARHLVHQLLEMLGTSKRNGLSRNEAWNRCLVLASRAARAHCWLLIWRRMEEASRLTHIKEVAEMRCLLGLCLIQDDLGDFMESGYLTPEHARYLHSEVVEVLHELRPKAVSLVDAFDFTDTQLCTCIGNQNGHPYENLINEAQRTALNFSPEALVLKHIKPIVGRSRL